MKKILLLMPVMFILCLNIAFAVPTPQAHWKFEDDFNGTIDETKGWVQSGNPVFVNGAPGFDKGVKFV